MLRILLAVISSLVLVGLIPFLNKKRPSKDHQVVSYRLNRFEPQKLLKQPTLEDPIIQKKILEQEPVLANDDIALKPIATPAFNFKLQADMSFTATGIAGLQVGQNMAVPPNRPVKMVQGGVSLYSPKPRMPLRAMQLGMSGKVKVQFKINEQGLVENIKIIEASHRMFRSAVIKVLKKYRFSPFLDVNGKPVAKIRTREFEFNVK